MSLRGLFHEGIGLIVVMHAADEFHERVAQHLDRFLDGQDHDHRGDEEVAGVVQEVERPAGRQQHQHHRGQADAERDHAVHQGALRLRAQHHARIADAGVLAAVVHKQAETGGHGQDLVDHHGAEGCALPHTEHEVVPGHLRHVQEREHEQGEGEDRLADRVDRLQREHAVGEPFGGAHGARGEIGGHQARDHGDHSEGGVEEHGLQTGHEEHDRAGDDHEDVDDDAHAKGFAFDLLMLHRWSFRIAWQSRVAPPLARSVLPGPDCARLVHETVAARMACLR